MTRLPPPPDLRWGADGAPRAAHFDDVYFSKDNGLAEAETVFLTGCGLPEAWRGAHTFAICELGFGTGLNVLAAWRAWKMARSPHAILHILSIEAFPLAREDAARALERFPEISTLSERLLAQWPVRAHAPQRLWFPADGFALTLFTGDAATVLSDLEGAFDAWFLDGFAPARNPEMWSPEVFRSIARLSKPGARAATFSVAGDVRRGLESAGFEVRKAPGFGAKRERLEARFTGAAEPRRSMFPYSASCATPVAVIGAGIAGASCAHALARRGVEAVVIEADKPASGASGNPAGLVMPRLDRAGPLASFHLSAYLHAVAEYEALGVFDPCGVEVRPGRNDAEALADLMADPPLPHDWFSPAPGGGVLHVRAGVAHPAAAVEQMLRKAQVMTGVSAAALERVGDAWSVRGADGRELVQAESVVLANGAGLTRLECASFLPTELSYGQIEWGNGAAPPAALVRSNYVAPYEGGVLFGATFDAYSGQDGDAAFQEDARPRNLSALRNLAPEIAASVDVASLKSRGGVRVTTPDRAPIAGLLPDAEAWLAQYAGLKHGRRVDLSATPPARGGIYVLGGLGARGLTWAPLLGERIACEICGEPRPVTRRALEALHPARFLLRALKRG